jgi:hypothetical protein
MKLEARDIIRDPQTGVLRVTGYAVKWDSINAYGENFFVVHFLIYVMHSH